ncbi:rRNA maturation RNase YbeY [Mycoplasmopsis iners]|uniref:rRNA maturation RNase YbeY n=1 Tax=Mycoplasmopsis iners TaxID=76630 RepID=UPI000495850F|nr:rRNA maturation RNase YbeY [Mycoplasmopsis iners]
MVELNIEINAGNSFKYENEFRQILENLRNYFEIDKIVSVDVSIVDNQTIQSLNKEYRGKDYPTDILSFDFGEQDFYNEMPFLPLGELVISHEKVESQANEFGHSLKREYCYLFAHGLIHLMGYDHEEENERIEMNKMVDDIFNPLGITRKND